MSGELPILTIGIPTFNSSKTIAGVLSCVGPDDICQKVILVSDNGSTDQTCSVVQEFAESDRRIKLIKHELNRGALWNFNYLLKSAQTPFFSWLGSDDYVAAGFHESCVRELSTRPNAVLCFGQIMSWVIGDQEPFIRHNNDPQIRGSILTRLWRAHLRFPDPAVYGVMRTESAMAIGGLPRCPGADIAFIRSLSLRGEFLFNPDAVYHYVGQQEWKSIAKTHAETLNHPKSLASRGWLSGQLTKQTLKYAREVPSSPLVRLFLMGEILFLEVLRLLGRSVISVVGVLPGVTRNTWFARTLHRVFARGGKYDVLNSSTFDRRVVYPFLRWDSWHTSR